MSKIIVWNIEKAIHYGPANDYKKEPIDICYCKEDANTKLKLAVAEYCEQFDNPVIDDRRFNDILVYQSPDVKYPYAEFWLYSAVVQEE